MKRISLIANSSIQYYKFKSKIDLDFGKENRVYYHEPFDEASFSFILDPLLMVKKNGTDLYYRKQDLLDKNQLINGNLIGNSDLDDLTSYHNVYVEGNLKNALKHYQRKWIPLPFFKNNMINRDTLYPTDWVRVYIDCDDNFESAKIVLSIDTALARSENDYTGPKLSLNPEENKFRLYHDDLNLTKYLANKESSSSWIEMYLSQMYYEKNPELQYDKPVKQFEASYILLIHWLSSLIDMPEIQLFANEGKKKSVDLVIDIGNSATCALLFENNDNDSSFEFENVKKLKIQDYSNPHLEYDDPFPMNLIFSEPNYGDLDNEFYHNNKFITPSFVRIGFEAERLINQSITDLSLGYELKTYNSSPKRYLWDHAPAEREWEFNPQSNKQVKKVYLSGISDQIKIDGELVEGNQLSGSKSLFSRSSLMKFVFLEMLVHAYIQINSFEFRQEHGNMTVPRRLDRITISCPTGMIQHEQIMLRKAAEDACKLLNNYADYYYELKSDSFWFEVPEITPSVKDLSKDLSQLEEKVDWNYDEATSSQLVFLYSMFAKKLKSNNYVIDHYFFKNKEYITLGSIDIGAGTTDIMINRYSLKKENEIDFLNPQPLFWDTFKNAGDDMLREIIQRIVIEGDPNRNIDGGDVVDGVGQYAKSIGISDVAEKLNGFFGKDSNQMGYKARVVRKAFIQQIAIPIAMEFLKAANSDEQKIKTFEEIIDRPFKNKEILKYFEKHFGFNILDIKWLITKERVNETVEAVFDSLIRQISVVMNQFDCDYVVLSGKPASLNSLENMFRKYLSISPVNLVNLNNYWIGRWYPFADNNGYIEEPKTVVSVGALIALMTGKTMKINDLRLNTVPLREKLVSTADYIINNENSVKKEILTPKKNDHMLSVPKLPFQIGYSKYLEKNYPYSDLYSIQLNSSEIDRRVRMKYPGRDERYIEDQINVEKGAILTNMPLKISLIREFDESKEILQIESVEDAEGNDKPVNYFSLNFQTLPDEAGYWLDTCEFILKVN